MDATDWAIEGTVIWASRAEGLVARAGAPACTIGIGRGASGRTATGALDAGLDFETALPADAAALLFAAAVFAAADAVFTCTGFFAAGLAAVLTALPAGLAGVLDLDAGLALFAGAFLAAVLALATGLAFGLLAGLAFFAAGLPLAAGLAAALAVFFAGAALPLVPAFAFFDPALVWGFKSGLLATAAAWAWPGAAGLVFSGGGSPS